MVGTAQISSLIDAALGYAERGWAVFPTHTMRDGRCSCGLDPSEEGKNAGKHPRTPHGLDDASVDETQIRSWWSRWPDANVAVATGQVSGLVVIDVDGDEGDETLEQLQLENGELPDTAQGVTGGDGFHYLFAHPGVRIRNSARKKLGPGLDVRGDGGYIIVPPSMHKSGQRYEWISLSALAELPDWLLERLREPPPRPSTPPASPTLRADGGTPYGLQALGKELDDLRGAGEGRRNDQLNESSFAMGQLVAGGELEEGLVVSTLTDIALGIGLTETETDKTIHSGLEGGKRQPRKAPERPAPIARATSGGGQVRHLKSVAGGAGGGAGAAAAPLEDEPVGDDQHQTDLGNARRLAALHGNELRYCQKWGSWLVWDGKRWRRDDTGEVYRRAKHTVERIYVDALYRTGDQREKLIKHALRSESSRAIDAMVRLAQSEPKIAADPDRLDRDPWLLNVENGTIDLRTGQLRNHRPGDGITRLVPVEYSADATCPTWLAFLDRALDGDAELVTFLQRSVGYTLTGNVSEQVLFFLHGFGANGKSTFLTTLQDLFGDYGTRTEHDLLVARYGEVHPTGMADLAGVRLAVTVEVEQGRRLAESMVKELTGGDRIKARRMRQDFFEFEPTHKLWLGANHKPIVKGTDHAIWRRIRLVPFTVTIPADQQDRRLVEKLREELPGVLTWAVEGCRQWRESGLGAPAAMVDATRNYRGEMDTIGQFLDESCDVDQQLWITAAELRKAYSYWCEGIGESPVNAKVFGQALTERGFQRKQQGREKRWTWFGLALRVEWTPGAALAGPSRPFSQDDTSRARENESTAKKGRAGRDGPRLGDEELFADMPGEPPSGDHAGITCGRCGSDDRVMESADGEPLCKACRLKVGEELLEQDEHDQGGDQ